MCDLFEMCLKIFGKYLVSVLENTLKIVFERKYLMLFEGFEKYLVSVLENILKSF